MYLFTFAVRGGGGLMFWDGENFIPGFKLETWGQLLPHVWQTLGELDAYLDQLVIKYKAFDVDEEREYVYNLPANKFDIVKLYCELPEPVKNAYVRHMQQFAGMELRRDYLIEITERDAFCYAYEEARKNRDERKNRKTVNAVRSA